MSRSLRIGINARFASARVSGVERYARNVVERLTALAPARGHSLVVFAPSNQDTVKELSLPPHCKVVSAPMLPTAIGRHAWEQFALPRLARREKVDVLINLANTAPISFDGVLLCLHDVSWSIGPAWFSPAFRLLYSYLIPTAAQRARVLVAGADGPADDIAAAVGVPRSKINVIPYGVSDSFSVREAHEYQSVLAKHNITQPYILHVGTLQPRKNIERLLLAYQQLRTSLGDQAPNLVLAGGTGSQFAQMRIETLLQTPGVRAIGYCSDDELPDLYSGALAVVSASLYEGYGLTLLEAMKCGSPLVVSDIPPHRASAGNVGIFVDPLDVDSIARGLAQSVANASLRARLISEGLELAKQYTWTAHVEKMLNVIDACFISSEQKNESPQCQPGL